MWENKRDADFVAFVEAQSPRLLVFASFLTAGVDRAQNAAYHVVDSVTYGGGMSTQIAIRLDDSELAALDAEVAEGRAANRSEAVRRGIARLQRDQRYRSEEATLVELARRGESVYPDLDGLADLPHPRLD